MNIEDLPIDVLVALNQARRRAAEHQETGSISIPEKLSPSHGCTINVAPEGISFTGWVVVGDTPESFTASILMNGTEVVYYQGSEVRK